MNKIVFFTVAVLALQALSVGAGQDVDWDEARLGGALDILDPSRVLTLVKEVLETVRNETKNARKDIGTRIGSLIAELRQAAEYNVKDLTIALQNLTTDARSLAACLGQQERSPQEVIGQLFGDVQGCIRKLTTGVGASMKGLFAVEKAAQALVKNATTSIQKCLQSGILGSVTCLAGVLPDVVLQSAALRVNASEISEELRTYLVLGAAESVKCLGNATSERVAQAFAVLAEISECVHLPSSTQDSTTPEQEAETTESSATEPATTATETTDQPATEAGNESTTEQTRNEPATETTDESAFETTNLPETEATTGSE